MRKGDDESQVKYSEMRRKKTDGSPGKYISSNALWALCAISLALVLYLSWPSENFVINGTVKEGPIDILFKNIRVRFEDVSIDFRINSSGHEALTGSLGASLPDHLRPPTADCDPGKSDRCIQYGDFARLYLTDAKDSNENCARVEWYSPFARRLEDCFDLADGVHWYGGGGPTYLDTWPIETVSRKESAVVSGDTLSGGENYMYGGVTENYWLLTSGAAIHVDEDVPLFISVNSTHLNRICLVSQDVWPYKNRGEVRLKYDLCVGRTGENFKDVHQRALAKYYPRPSKTPDERMLVQPLWSTWAEYKTGIDQSIVIELAHRLIKEGFSNSSHIEIDDFWETCYGDMEFNTKFLNPKGMTTELRKMGFRSTLWVHPFINYGCPSFQVAFDLGFLVQDERSKVALTTWWNGKNAGIVDFTNEAAVTWWIDRLKRIQSKFGIDSFKFDAGESNWLPYSHKFADVNHDPAVYTQKYVQAVAQFGGLVEVRSARRTQNESIFVRMLDKDSRWGYDNGLRSLIPTLLDFGLKGYPFVMPDMIGGNAYNDGRPSKELYIRWMQVNSFMPCVQFSILPWEYDQETVKIVQDILQLRFKYSDNILGAARQATVDGSPINRPLWWVDPSDHKTYSIDDQYMLGDEILVAPVTKKGATSRNIYLPKGNWISGVNASSVYKGPLLLQGFPAPLYILPYFIKQ